jgi:Domain of unknown function (DUF397)
MNNRTGWRKSSYSSGPNGACVEVTATAVRIDVRDTTDRDGGTLHFGPASWSAFCAEVRAGSFDK